MATCVIGKLDWTLFAWCHSRQAERRSYEGVTAGAACLFFPIKLRFTRPGAACLVSREQMSPIMGVFRRLSPPGRDRFILSSGPREHCRDLLARSHGGGRGGGRGGSMVVIGGGRSWSGHLLEAPHDPGLRPEEASGPDLAETVTGAKCLNLDVS